MCVQSFLWVLAATGGFSARRAADILPTAIGASLNPTLVSLNFGGLSLMLANFASNLMFVVPRLLSFSSVFRDVRPVVFVHLPYLGHHNLMLNSNSFVIISRAQDGAKLDSSPHQ